jgi:hypothetical protein
MILIPPSKLEDKGENMGKQEVLRDLTEKFAQK